MHDDSSIDVHKMQQAAGQAVLLLKKLANRDRLMLLCKLSQGEMSVGEIEAALQIYQPTLSQQLAVLRREGLIEARREGKQIYYHMAHPQALAVIHVLYTLFCTEPVEMKSESKYEH